MADQSVHQSDQAEDSNTSLNVYILTFNCARTLVRPGTFAPYLFHARPQSSVAHSPELLVLCLQELAPISYAFLGGSFLTAYFNAWREVVRLAAAKDHHHSYVNVVSRNVGMTGIMVFAREDVAENVKWLKTAGVGVGVSEMGNKGAVGVRIGYQGSRTGEEVGFTFVAAHLAPMEDALERRNEDYKNIVRRLVFVPDSQMKKAVSGEEEEEDVPLLQGNDLPQHEPIDDTVENGMYSSSSHLFFAGDLNYRTSLLQPSPQDVDEKFPHPTSNEADPRHFQQLLADDQLTQQVKAQRTLQGLSEAPITFPPTYKYHTDGSKAVIFADGDEDLQRWSWARHRWPSWCDRIFFWNDRGSNGDVKVTPQKYTCLPLFATSDHRPVALAATVPLKVVSNAEEGVEGGGRQGGAPFSIDPEWKSRRAQARTKELVVGLLAYLTLTWEGNGLVLATAIGVVGGWLIIRSFLMA